MNLIDFPGVASPIVNPKLYPLKGEYEKTFTPQIGPHTLMFFPGPDVTFERWPRSVSSFDVTFKERWGY